ncbi:4685_t:CDS:2, partial [Funneliformis geosporum]
KLKSEKDDFKRTLERGFRYSFNVVVDGDHIRVREQTLRDKGAALEMFTEKKDQEAFKISIFNSNFYSRAAGEIMEKIFTSDEKEKLKNLIEGLEKEENSLIVSARSEVSKTINEHKNRTLSLHDYNSLNFDLLGLIKVDKENFPQSYNLFERVLNTLNQDKELYDQGKIKEHFSQALEELEKLVKSVKSKKKPNKTKKEESANVGEENVENETPPEQTPPNQNQSEGDKNVPTDSNEKPEGQNNSENNENTNEPNNDTSSNLQTLKTQVISEITAALNETPLLNNSDLSSKYQDWENEINNLSDEKDINFLKTSVLFDIEDQRKEKVKRQSTGEV